MEAMQAIFEQIGGLSQHIDGVSHRLSSNNAAQTVTQIVPSYSGDPKQFHDWVKNVEKAAVLTNTDTQADRVHNIAYQASSGPVSDFIHRYLKENQSTTWPTLKAELTIRFC